MKLKGKVAIITGRAGQWDGPRSFSKVGFQLFQVEAVSD